MRRYIVSRSSLTGSLQIPASKSHTLRAILFAAMAKGKSIIYSPLFSDDVKKMIEACGSLRAKISKEHQSLIIEGIDGKVADADNVIDAGNSGIVLRFCSAIAALSEYPIVITGDASIRYQRPMKELLNGLNQLGVQAISTKKDGFAPVIIQGPIQRKNATIRGEDSQPVSALLIAAAFAKWPIEIQVINPGEIPWILLTLDWFKRLNITFEHDAFRKFKVFGPSSYRGFEYHVPGDFSSAAFAVAAALITQSELELTNLNFQDIQGDKQLLAVLQQMGANIEILDNKVKVKKTALLKGISVDVNSFIDCVPILAVIGCFAKGKTRLTNAQIARSKECDRLKACALELRKMGGLIEETEDGLEITQSSLHGSEDLFSHHDHRMAMSLTVAAMAASENSSISGVECISKTYPSFLEDFKACGARIQEVIF